MTDGRVVHCKQEPYDVLIDRTTAWGNPYVSGIHGSRDEVIAKYEHWVLTDPGRTAEWIRANVGRLRGKVLGCWCAPKACHGDVLLALANDETMTDD